MVQRATCHDKHFARSTHANTELCIYNMNFSQSAHIQNVNSLYIYVDIAAECTIVLWRHGSQKIKEIKPSNVAHVAATAAAAAAYYRAVHMKHLSTGLHSTCAHTQHLYTFDIYLSLNLIYCHLTCFAVFV
jgi:hypothetical protein